MVITPRPGLPYIWVTWVKDLLAGEGYCEYQPWFRAHFKYDKAPRDSKLEQWTLEHGAMVADCVASLKARGYSVTLENQNAFRLTGKTAILAGKPDIIARKDDQVLVLDCKTGQPSTKDWVQVAIYLIVIPMVWKRTLAIEGELVYRTHSTIVPQEQALTQVRDRLFALLRKIGQATALPTVPSERECAWCDIAECPDRWSPVEDEPVDAMTVSF